MNKKVISRLKVNSNIICYELTIILILIIVYGYLYFNKYIILYWGDETQQVIPFFTDIYNQIKNGSFSFWNYKIGLGASNFVHFFTMLGSPSFYIFLLLPKAELISYFIPIVDFLRFLFIAYFSYKWLEKVSSNHLAAFVGGIIFTFSGWSMYWMHFSYFLDAYLYLAIILYLCECVLENEKKISFVVMISLCTILSLYISYMIIWFLFFYFNCRIFMLEKKISIKIYSKYFFNIFSMILLGIGLAGFVFLPSLYSLLSADRISTTGNLFSIIDLGSAFRVLTSFFSPVINDFDYNIFSSPFINASNKVYTVYLYSFSIFILLLPQIFFVKFKGRKKLLQSIVCLYSMLFVMFFYFLFNGNNSVRWSYYFIVFNILLIAKLIENKEQFNLHILLLSGFVFILFLGILSYVSIEYNFTTEINVNQIKKNFIILSICVILSVISFMKVRRLKYFLALSLIVEAVYCFYSRSINGDQAIIADQASAKLYIDKMYDTEAIDILKENDTDFYRIDYASNDSLAYNYPMIKNYMGFSSYISIYNFETRPLIDDRISDSWFIGYTPSKFLLKSLLGSKYLIVDRSEEMWIPYGYNKYIDLENQVIYRNKLDNSLGFASSDLLPIKDSIRLDKSLEEMIFMNYIVCEDCQVNSFQDAGKNMDVQILGENIINSSVKVPKEKGYVFVDYSNTIPFSTITADFYKNGDLVKNIYREEFGYTVFDSDEQYDEIYFYVQNYYNKNEYVPANIYWVSEFELDTWYNNLQNKPHFYDIDLNGSTISAKINVKERNTIGLTTIPYNPGWSVKVNGKKRNILRVNDAMIGFELSEGENEITMQFIPYGIKLGILISGISMIILGYFIYINIYSKKSKIKKD